MRGGLKNSIFWVAILTAFLIGTWLENDSSDFYQTYISPIAHFQIPVMVVLVVGAGLFQFYNHRMAHFEEQIADYEQQVRNGSRALWKYFKDIGETKVREIVSDIMTSFTKRHNHVLAVQIYEYSVKHLRTHTLYTVTHKYSYVSENSDINALLQTHYRIPKDLYDEYIYARIHLHEKVLLESNITYANDFCKKYLQQIEGKDTQAYTEEDAIAFALVEIILDRLSMLLHTDFSPNPTEEQLQKMHSLKRTGVLKGIESAELYTFEYKGFSEKIGRKYITQTLTDPDLFAGIPHIVLITLNPEYLPDDLLLQQEELWKLGDDFTDELQKELKIRYNELKEAIS